MEIAFCIQGRGPDAVRGPGGKAPEAKQVLPVCSDFDIKCTLVCQRGRMVKVTAS